MHCDLNSIHNLVQIQLFLRINNTHNLFPIINITHKLRQPILHTIKLNLPLNLLHQNRLNLPKYNTLVNHQFHQNRPFYKIQHFFINFFLIHFHQTFKNFRIYKVYGQVQKWVFLLDRENHADERIVVDPACVALEAFLGVPGHPVEHEPDEAPVAPEEVAPGFVE